MVGNLYGFHNMNVIDPTCVQATVIRDISTSEVRVGNSLSVGNKFSY